MKDGLAEDGYVDFVGISMKMSFFYYGALIR
jgi:hypothetical protein